MAEKGSQGQTDKAAAEAKTAQVGQDASARANSTPEDTNAGLTVGADANNPDGSVPADAEASQNQDTTNPYPNYDFMTLEALRSLADSRGVEMNRDVEKAHLITELRAADSGTVSPALRKGAR